MVSSSGSYSQVRGHQRCGTGSGILLWKTAEASRHAFMTGPNGMGMKELDTLGRHCLTLLGSTMQGRSWVPRVFTVFSEARPCFHHRTRRRGHDRPWHFGRYLLLQPCFRYQRRRAGGGVVRSSATPAGSPRLAMFSSPAANGDRHYGPQFMRWLVCPLGPF